MSETAHTIPCKRPKVIVEQPTGADLYLVRCHVQGCGWTYGPAIKTDATQQATQHRCQHRAAAPNITYTRGSQGGFAVHWTCDCGAGAEASTRSDAVASSGYHLASAHGLVIC